MDQLVLYNSLTQKKEPFQPIHTGIVRMYVCGMTVYDYCHIGHARVMIVFDTLARHLRTAYRLTYVRNITDIDDKIIRRAQENNESISALTTRFITAMHQDEQALGCLPPDIEPRATDHIDEIIAMISELINKGYAYKSDNGDIYYAVRHFSDYGKLAHRQLEDLRVGERVEINPFKRDPLDFVLWKSAKPDEPYWESPWGHGRPGWHIECSVMSTKTLGTHFDIHGGGMDLKFPHHECEIAQSEAVYSQKTVNYWLHNGFVQINNEKMSKSLGNFFTVRDVLAHYDGETIRFFMLQTHYRSPLNYSDIGLAEAQRALTRLYAALDKVDSTKSAADTTLCQEENAAFLAALNDDLNTPRALSILFNLAKRIYRGTENQAKLAYTLRVLGNQLGLLTQSPADYLKGNAHSTVLTEAEIESLITARNAAKAIQDFQRADEIRQTLNRQGITIKDTPKGTQWSYTI